MTSIYTYKSRKRRANETQLRIKRKTMKIKVKSIKKKQKNNKEKSVNQKLFLKVDQHNF